VSETFRRSQDIPKTREKTMSENEVPRDAAVKLGHVEGDLKVGQRARIEAKSGNLVSVSGDASFKGAAEILCDFECDSLQVSSGGALRVSGNLIVRKLLDVNHSVEVDGEIRAEDIDVGGRIKAKSLSCTRMRVGGKIDIEKAFVVVESLSVGGKVSAPGTVSIKDFDVGGQAEIGGGKITGKITVGGKFESGSKLEFGDLKVYGTTKLSGGSRGTRISTNGHFSVSGDFESDEVNVLGKTNVQGTMKAKKCRVNGILEVEGALLVEELLEISGRAKVEHELTGTSIHVGGKLEADKIVVSNNIEIAGYTEAHQGLKAKIVKVGGGSRVEGTIVADQVDVGGSYGVLLDYEKRWMGQVAAMRLVGKMTRVDDVYAEEVHIGKVASCGRIFAGVVEVEPGCSVREINYTGELRGDVAKIHFEMPPLRVQDLPVPPL
jgi:cytoskeletal protein CcmA (bactofilin family)